MKFKTLEIQNFLTIKEAKINLADRGLHLIQGVNADDSSASSNGAGKSSMVDAICWCLFGLTAREVKGDAVVNLGAKKECKVTLFVTNGTSEHRITRYRKHSTGKNTLEVFAQDPGGEVETNLSRGTDAETQKLLEKILGCSYEVFMAAVYSGQEAMPDLPKMKDRELKTLIEEAAGMQRIERAYEASRERFNLDKMTATSAQSYMEGAHMEHHSAKEAHDSAIGQRDSWEAGRETRVGESTLAVMGARTRLDDALTELGKHDLKPHRDRIIEIDTELANHKTLEAQAIDAEKLVRTRELAVDASLLKRLAADVTRVETQIANAATEIKKPCGECGTVLETMSIEEYVEHRTMHLTAAQRKLEDGKVTARAQIEAVLTQRTMAATFRAAVPDVSALVTERATEEVWLRNYDQIGATAHRLNLDKIAAESQLALRTTETNPYAASVEAQHKRLTAAIAKVSDAVAKLDAAKKAQEISAAVVKVFGPAGVRAQILDTVTPFLNARTADYLSALSDGEITAVWTTLTRSASGDLKEKFSLDVTHAKGGDSFLALSGGEKRKVRLATALALQDLVASRATQPLDIWIGDEIDDALDPAGLERLMTILERKARERGTVLVISHSDLRDWIDNVTTVRKGEQWTSTVEGSLCS